MQALALQPSLHVGEADENGVDVAALDVGAQLVDGQKPAPLHGRKPTPDANSPRRRHANCVRRRGEVGTGSVLAAMQDAAALACARLRPRRARRFRRTGARRAGRRRGGAVRSRRRRSCDRRGRRDLRLGMASISRRRSSARRSRSAISARRARRRTRLRRMPANISQRPNTPTSCGTTPTRNAAAGLDVQTWLNASTSTCWSFDLATSMPTTTAAASSRSPMIHMGCSLRCTARCHHPYPRVELVVSPMRRVRTRPTTERLLFDDAARW